MVKTKAAKAKAATRKKVEKKVARKQSKRDAEKVLRRGPIRRAAPRQDTLIDLRRIAPLDDVCAAISRCRADINELKSEEAGYEQTALSLMRKHSKTTWKHNGVQLVRVPGEEKLQVKTSRSGNATAEVEEEAEPADVTAMDGDGLNDDLDAEHDSAISESRVFAPDEP